MRAHKNKQLHSCVLLLKINCYKLHKNTRRNVLYKHKARLNLLEVSAGRSDTHFMSAQLKAALCLCVAIVGQRSWFQ